MKNEKQGYPRAAEDRRPPENRTIEICVRPFWLLSIPVWILIAFSLGMSLSARDRFQIGDLAFFVPLFLVCLQLLRYTLCLYCLNKSGIVRKFLRRKEFSWDDFRDIYIMRTG